jgi:purine-nucleoside phosphorylase
MMPEIKHAVNFIKQNYRHKPAVSIVLGSGLGSLTDEIKIEKQIRYSDIYHFPVSTENGIRENWFLAKQAGKKWWPWLAVFIFIKDIRPNRLFSR